MFFVDNLADTQLTVLNHQISLRIPHTSYRITIEEDGWAIDLLACIDEIRD